MTAQEVMDVMGPYIRAALVAVADAMAEKDRQRLPPIPRVQEPYYDWRKWRKRANTVSPIGNRMPEIK